MRGAFGKPQGLVARTKIGDIIMSVRTKENNVASAIEAFRRAKFKFPGRQHVSPTRIPSSALEGEGGAADLGVDEVRVHAVGQGDVRGVAGGGPPHPRRRHGQVQPRPRPHHQIQGLPFPSHLPFPSSWSWDFQGWSSLHAKKPASKPQEAA